jgi:hypothetical protein
VASDAVYISSSQRDCTATASSTTADIVALRSEARTKFCLNGNRKII